MSSKSAKTDEAMRNRANGGKPPADAFDTGEDPELQAKLAALRRPNKQQALAVFSTEEIRVGAFLLKPTGLVIDGEITRPDWEQTGKLLKQLDSSMQWLIGDLIVYGESLEWGDQQKIAEFFGFEYATIRDYAYVARNVDLSVRTDKLDFGHHKLVAGMEQEEQLRWLQAAAEGDNGKRWSVKQLREAIKADSSYGTPEIESTPKYLQPVSALRKAYSPQNWKSLKKSEKLRIHSELKGLLLNMEADLGITSDE